MAKKESLKKAVALPEGGLQWSWNGLGEVRHTVTWDGKTGQSVWVVWHGELPMRAELPWFLVKARGEVQENIRHFRNAHLDRIHANRALHAVGMLADQHFDTPGYCNCWRCTPEETS
jgi:hypothetical protein